MNCYSVCCWTSENAIGERSNHGVVNVHLIQCAGGRTSCPPDGSLTGKCSDPLKRHTIQIISKQTRVKPGKHFSFPITLFRQAVLPPSCSMSGDEQRSQTRARLKAFAKKFQVSCCFPPNATSLCASTSNIHALTKFLYKINFTFVAGYNPERDLAKASC